MLIFFVCFFFQNFNSANKNCTTNQTFSQKILSAPNFDKLWKLSICKVLFPNLRELKLIMNVWIKHLNMSESACMTESPYVYLIWKQLCRVVQDEGRGGITLRSAWNALYTRTHTYTLILHLVYIYIFIYICTF